MSSTLTSVDDLRRTIEQGSTPKFLFFWGHQPERDGSTGKGCLSQWWPAPFTVDSRTFATAEHYMMWRKAILFGDTATAELVIAAGHPHAAKTLGREVRGFDDRAWRETRFEVVVTASRAKFGQHPELLTYLLGTGDRILAEASPVDRIWGIGLGVEDPRATNPAQWPGLNLLGFALMSARAALHPAPA